MSFFGPVGGRSGQAYKKKKRRDPAKDIIKQGHTTLRKLKGGKITPVKYPSLYPPSAHYGPRLRPVGGGGDGRGGGDGSSAKGTPKVGSGPGKPGDLIGRIISGGSGKEAGDEFQDPIYRELKKKELINWMKNELELELIKRGGLMKFTGWKYPAFSNHGPESLLSLEETIKAMYQRQIVEAENLEGDIKAYFTHPDRDPAELTLDELIVFLEDETDDLSNILVLKDGDPIPAYSLRLGLLGFDLSNLKERDLRYIFPVPRYKIDKDAVVVFMRDVSGSISNEEMEMSYIITLLIELWLEDAYEKQVKSVYIAHNHGAWEESEEGYYSLESGGGTSFNEGYDIILSMIEHRDYPRRSGVEKKIINSDETDIYLVQMTDGWNWDHYEAINKLKTLMPHLTRKCYLETAFGGFWQGYWGGVFGHSSNHHSAYWKELEENFPKEIEARKLRMHPIESIEGVWDAMRVFFGKKKTG